MTSKTKNIILVLGLVLFAIISYHLSIAKTIDVYTEYSNLEAKQGRFENIPKQMALLNQKKKFYDSILNGYKLKSNALQNDIINTINTHSKDNKASIVNFSEPHLEQKAELLLKTYRFTLAGEFESILRLIHTIETQTKFGEVLNLEFEKKKNYKTGKYFLHAHVLLRSFG